MGRVTVRVACGASLIIGLSFVFVWAPHPWGWAGFDQYYDLGRVLARGKPFPTTDVPWGYAYFLAAFYRLFGDRPWIPLLVQVALNALMPALTYQIARDLFDEATALVAAILTGFMSFNTVYASTQSSDAVCNVLFMAAVLVFIRARARGDWTRYAAAGALFGIAPQFRPNLILIPAVLGAFRALEGRSPRAAQQGTLLVAVSLLMLAPWMVRNYRLTGEILPTSTHGGVQLWYGTLQTGPYLHSRAHNPRSVFETGSFPYTSLERVPLIVSGRLTPCARVADTLRLVYWTDRDATRHTATVDRRGPVEFEAQFPATVAPTVYYYAVDGIDPPDADEPRVFFVSTDHLGDQDTHGDLLDVFDVLRLMRHAAWGDTPEFADRLDLDDDGRLTASDAAAAARILAEATDPERGGPNLPRFRSDTESGVLTFSDGSTIEVPRLWSGRITDAVFSGGAAEAVLHTSVPFTRKAGDRHAACVAVAQIGVNTVFYRAEPHAMRRYTALAFDNIRRNPVAYVASTIYRAGRVFFIEGSDDPHTTHQFAGGGRVYRAAFAVSIVLLAVALTGVWLAWRRGAAIALPLLLIAYIPATLAFVLTNMRYSITVQPLVFMFAATTIVTVLEGAGWTARRREENETARQP